MANISLFHKNKSLPTFWIQYFAKGQENSSRKESSRSNTLWIFFTSLFFYLLSTFSPENNDMSANLSSNMMLLLRWKLIVWWWRRRDKLVKWCNDPIRSHSKPPFRSLIRSWSHSPLTLTLTGPVCKQLPTVEEGWRMVHVCVSDKGGKNKPVAITKTGGFSFPVFAGKRILVGITSWICDVWKFRLRSKCLWTHTHTHEQTVTSCLVNTAQQQKMARNVTGGWRSYTVKISPSECEAVKNSEMLK